VPIWIRVDDSSGSPLFEGGEVVVIDDQWLHFADNLITGVNLASHPLA